MANTDVQMTIRLEKDFHDICKERADYAGQTFAEWIRRAMRAQLEQELNTAEDEVSDQRLEALIEKVLNEKLAEKRRRK